MTFLNTYFSGFLLILGHTTLAWVLSMYRKYSSNVYVSWVLQLTFRRSRFRKIVYQINDWKINFKPNIGSIYPNTLKYIQIRNSFSIYLLVCLLLFTNSCFSANTNSEKEKMEIKIGSTIPDIVLKNQDGKLFNLKNETAGKNVVLFFYPKDDTPGCTAQACSFRDQFEDFVDANAVVVGISGQSVESHKNFATKHSLTYTLLSDEDNKIRKEFGVPTNLFGLLPGRVTYVMNKENKVVYIFNSQTKVEEHVTKTLEILQNKD